MRGTTIVVMLIMLSGIAFGEFAEVQPAKIYVQDSIVEKKVCASLHLKNTGSQIDDVLIEMQVRPEGSPPLSIFGSSSEFKTGFCDETMPANPSVKIKTFGGETVDYELCTKGIKPGNYDVYLISVNKCWADPPEGNIKLPPYRVKKVATITVPSNDFNTLIKNPSVIVLIAMALIVIFFMR